MCVNVIDNMHNEMEIHPFLGSRGLKKLVFKLIAHRKGKGQTI